MRTANSGRTPKITLLYFSDINNEIDEYFNIACEIVEGRRNSLLDKPAMKAITNGCSTTADIAVKKSDFYYLLQYSYGITEDPNDNYYDEEYCSSNLESFEYEDEADKNKKKELAIKLISHINKLRNGNHYHSDIDAEHLIVTNTKATLLISNEQAESIKEEEKLDRICNFAVSLDRITSLLWYKLGNGFSQKAYPTSVTAVLKARVVLSASIAKKAALAFSEVKQQYETNAITEHQVAARILTFKHKPTLPEELQGDDIDEIMNFSPEYLSRYEEQFKDNQNALKEKDQVIQSLKADAQKTISEKNATIVSQQGLLKQKDEESNELRDQLQKYQREEEARAQKKKRWKNVAKFVWNITWKVSIIAVLTAIVIILDKKYAFTIPPLVYTIVDAIGLIIVFWREVKNSIHKHFPKTNKSKVDSH